MGHPRKYKERSKTNLDTGDKKNENKGSTSQDTFKDTLVDYFGQRRYFFQNEYSNQYSFYISVPESKYWRWLVTLSNNLVSKDLYSVLFLFSRNDAIEELRNRPNGTGLLRAVYHEKGSIAITYVEDNQVKHALLDVSSLHNYSLRNVLFCSKLTFLKNILVLGYDYNNKQSIISVPRTLLSYPVDQTLVSEIN